ncbi:hypothetical protein LZQ00_03230 [Sphingobacterium sp. SRCM116780]|uniref:hypothetical protein n=1 Tax=Sphingobacterium sp. SRCM116780 TaxID=2907623 RepID=UPI001F2999DC|nr:hypothetical protein [Sphingobacterium sp. SRCM116780]UIR56838.1 hypothetical protein LZQ00_03230 [Sphingobacterium sp. SRCM116780]
MKFIKEKKFIQIPGIKNQLFTVILFLVMVLSSCGNNQDFGYNEKMTSNFYSCKERLDERHKKLLAGDFDADKSSKTAFDMELKDAKGLGSYCNEIKTEASQLGHSEVANVFHEAVIRYMSKIEDEYTVLLTQYVEEQDSTARKAIRTQLETKKEELSALEDKCLAAQIAFLKEVGIQINEET